MEIKLNTKLRMENSTLGTYELTAGENNTLQCTLPKWLKPENLIGTIFNFDDISYSVLSSVAVINTEGRPWKYVLFIGTTPGSYYPILD